MVTALALDRHRRDGTKVVVVTSPWMEEGDDLGCSIGFNSSEETPFHVTFEPGSARVVEFGPGRYSKRIQA